MTSARFVRAAAIEGDLVRDGLPQVAFAGRSNVGKSSLLNRLLGRKKLARISSTPGRTRAVNYFLINGSFYFVDLPGYGFAKVAKSLRRAWGRLMDEYFRLSECDPRVLQLVDCKVGATALDVQAFDYLVGLGRRPSVVATRADRVPRGRRREALEGIRRALAASGDPPSPLPVSSRTGEGIRELWREIADHLSSART